MGIVRDEVLPALAPGLRTSVQQVATIGGGGAQAADIQFVINGPDLTKLESISRQLMARAKALPGVVDLDTSLNVGKPELSVRLDRPKAADLGVQIGDAAEALRLLVGGDQVTTYNEGGEQYEVHLRARAENRTTESAMAALTVPSSRLGSVSLDNVASFAPGTAPSDISRLARQRQVTVFCNLLPSASQAEVQNAILAEFNSLNAGSDYRGVFAGRSKELGRTAENFVLAFVLSLVFMYLILAAQFESWLHPITILLSLPLTLPFALLSIIVFRQSLNIFSALGLLVLFGVVKKNSILQIDHANQLKERRAVDARRHRAGQPRPAPSDSDDDARVRRRHDPAHRLEGHRLGHQPRDRVRDLRRPVAGAAADAARHAGGLLAVRRCVEGEAVRTGEGTVRATMAAPARRSAPPSSARPPCSSLLAVGLAATASAQSAAPDARDAAAHRGRGRPAGAREQPGSQGRPARSANQRHARRRGGRRVQADIQHERAAQRPAAAAGRVPDAPADHQQRRRPPPAASASACRGSAPATTSGGARRIPRATASSTATTRWCSPASPSASRSRCCAISTSTRARQQLITSRINRDIAGTRLSESVVRTTANVKSAYWNLVSAKANVDARRKAFELVEELVRVNKARVDVGTSPPIDLVSAQAELASNEEQLIIAETAVKEAEDRLRVLILDTTQRDAWTVALDAVDSPPVGLGAPDTDAAVATALRERTDLRPRAERHRDGADDGQVHGQSAPAGCSPERELPANGLGGTQVLRDGSTFPGTIIGSGIATPFGSVLGQLFGRDYPTWNVGVSVSYPIGQSAEEANHARARLESAQAQERLKSAEAKVIQQVRDAGWKIGMNARRVQTTRVARELAEQRFDAEQKRLDVGLSTNFLVIQAQRDLVQAKTNELSAVLAYDLALVDFDALQLAPPGGGTASTARPRRPATAAAERRARHRLAGRRRGVTAVIAELCVYHSNAPRWARGAVTEHTS